MEKLELLNLQKDVLLMQADIALAEEKAGLPAMRERQQALLGALMARGAAVCKEHKMPEGTRFDPSRLVCEAPAAGVKPEAKK